MANSTEGNDLSPSINAKNLSFTYKIIFNLFPDLFIFDTYRDKEFSRIDKDDTYASDLDYRNETVSKICNVDSDSHVAGIAFLSHTKKHSTSFPYSGKINSPEVNKRILKSNTTLNSNFDLSDKEVKLIEKMEVEFHTNLKYYTPFKGKLLKKENGNLKEKDVSSLDDEFYKLITNSRPKDQNDIILITGDIGCGKSTLLTNSLVRVLKDQHQVMISRPTNYIRAEHIVIDFEEIPPPTDDDIKAYSDKIINSHILMLVKKQLNKSGSDLISVLNKVPNNVIPILAFDNLDSLHTSFCKKLFVDNDPSDNTVEVRNYYPFLYELISAFTVGKYSGLGIRCIFAARNETADLLKEGLNLDDGDRSPFEAINSFLKLSRPDGAFISDIVKKRIALIRDNILDENKKTQLELNINSLSQKDSEFDEINILSIQGLRHTISVCRYLSWALLDNFAFKRFFIEEVATRLFHFLGGKTHFSQAKSGITNIFLVNNRYRIENNKQLKQETNSIENDLLDDHLHTYWLKYFVLYYINSNNVDKKNVVNLFSNNGKNGYPKNLVKLIIYSLSEIKHGRLIIPSITFGSGQFVHSSGLTCTRRAQHLIEKNAFWSFCYLSLVIEDEWLEFPLSLKDKFSKPSGFSFLFCTDKKVYEKEYSKYLINKSELVMIFLDLLEESLKYEKKKYPEVYKYLTKKGVPIPDIGKIKKETRKTILSLSNSVNDNDRKKIIKSMNKNKNWFNQLKFKKELKKVFKKTYYLGLRGKIRLAMSKATIN